MHLVPKTLAVAVLAISASSQAAPFTRMIAFGDSLTDAGQYPDTGAPAVDLGGRTVFTSGLRLVNRVGPTYAPDNTEVTSPMAVQMVSETLGLGQLTPSSPILPGIATGAHPGYNYAVAGAGSARILDSITAVDGATVAVEALGLATRRDGYLVEHGSADAEALYYVNGGANDIFAQIPAYVGEVQSALGGGAAPPSMGSANALAASSNLVEGVTALHDAGARYIMVSNLPDLGNTPLGAGLNAQFTAASAALDGFMPAQLNQVSGAFNSALYQGLNATGANVIPLNVNGLLDEVIASPVAYGFDAPAPAATCFDAEGADCGENPVAGRTSATPDPDRLLFNDAVHPTGRAQELIADYMVSILEAPAQVRMLTALGQMAISSDLDRVGVMESVPAEQVQGRWLINIQAERQENHTHNSLYNLHGRSETDSVALTGNYVLNDSWQLGVAVSDHSGDLDVDGGDSRYSMSGVGLTLYGYYRDGRNYADVGLAYGWNDYESWRATPIGDVARVETGETSGDNRGLVVEFGRDISSADGAWDYGPRVAFTYASTDVDSFAENGTSTTALWIGAQTQKTKRLEGGIFASYRTERLGITLEAGLHRDLEDRRYEVEMQQLALAETDRYFLPAEQASRADGFNTLLVLDYRITDRVQVMASHRLSNVDYTDRAINLGLGVSF